MSPRPRRAASRFAWFLALPLFSPAIAGCANAGNGEDGGTTHPTPDLSLPDPLALGKKLVLQSGCADCHDPGDHSLSGQTVPRPQTMAYGSNLTPDSDTGLGGWTDEHIARAIRTGVDIQDQELCLTMPRFADLTDPQVNALVSYLRAQKPVHHVIPVSICPPIKNPIMAAADLGTDDDGGVPPDLAMAPGDLSVPRDMASSPDGGVACNLKINEVQTGGSGGATDEFIELYNPCPSTIDITGQGVFYRAAAGTKDITLIAFGSGKLPSKIRVVLGGSGFTGAPDITYSGGSLAAVGGGLALKDGNGAVLDSMGWGTATNAYVRGTAAPAVPDGSSLERLPDGKDSGNNAADFKPTMSPTPRKTNQ